MSMRSLQHDGWQVDNARSAHHRHPARYEPGLTDSKGLFVSKANLLRHGSCGSRTDNRMSQPARVIRISRNLLFNVQCERPLKLASLESAAMTTCASPRFYDPILGRL